MGKGLYYGVVVILCRTMQIFIDLSIAVIVAVTFRPWTHLFFTAMMFVMGITIYYLNAHINHIASVFI